MDGSGALGAASELNILVEPVSVEVDVCVRAEYLREAKVEVFSISAEEVKRFEDVTVKEDAIVVTFEVADFWVVGSDKKGSDVFEEEVSLESDEEDAVENMSLGEVV